MKAVVTGGAGFIGSHIVDSLVDQGHQVKVIDNFTTGRLANLTSHLDKVEVVRGDIRDIDLLRREFAGFDWVVHQAGISSVPQSITDPIATNDNNILGTLNVLTAARDSGVKRVVYASSCSIYGDEGAAIRSERVTPNPISPYALSKHVGEIYCSLFYRLYGLETVSLRYFNVFGPRQVTDSAYSAVIPQFISATLAGQSVCVYGDGEQSRDFVYVKDIATANLLALATTQGLGEAINIASGESVTINQLIDRLGRIVGHPLAVVSQADRPGDVRSSGADIHKATQLLGYSPATTLDIGLKQTLAWYQDALMRLKI